MSSVVIKGDTSGQVTLAAPAVAGTVTVTMPSASGTMATNVNGDLYPLISGTAQTAPFTAPNTYADFTGIPSWAKRITVMFSGVSTNGTSYVQVQLGTSSGVVITGYNSSGFYYNSGAVSSSTTGLVVDQLASASAVRYGQTIISLLGSNTWVMSSVIANATTNPGSSSGGVTLSGTLDRVRITTINGTDTFDAGSINILYE